MGRSERPVWRSLIGGRRQATTTTRRAFKGSKPVRRPFRPKKVARELEQLRRRTEQLSDRADTLGPETLTRQLDEIVRTAQDIVARYGDPSPQRRLVGGADGLVVFVHVPRTGGSTMSSILQLQHGAGYVWGGNAVVRVERGRLERKGSWELDPTELRRRAAVLAAASSGASLIQAHMGLALASVFPQGSRFFTFLRDPARRTLSHYSYFLRRARLDAEAGGHPMPAELTLSEYLRSADRPDGFDMLAPDNLQTRMLSGLPLDAPASQRMLDNAKRNLGMLDMVGITERFGASVALLHLTYGWTLLLPPGRKHNATGLSPAEEDVDSARELNELDSQLYEEGLARFERAAAPFGSRVETDAAAMARAWELVLDSGENAAVSDDHGAAAVDGRAREILADTRELLGAELFDAIRRAGRLVSYAKVITETRYGLHKAGDGDLDPSARTLSLREANKAADGLDRRVQDLAAYIRRLGDGGDPAIASSRAEPDGHLDSIEPTPLD